MNMKVIKPKYPECIVTVCDCCGTVHKLPVIKLFSSAKKQRFCVFCKEKKKFYSLYKVL